MRRTMRAAATLAAALFATVPLYAQSTDADADADLAKQSQNPVANLISFPLQNNTSFNVGPADGVVNDLNIQPVYPFTVGKVNVINRFIMPVTYQGELVEGQGSEFGLGDLSYTAFISPAKAGAVTWGIGPSFIIPTATDDRLGAGKWSAGAGVVVLAMPSTWVVGFLVQNTWSFAGDDDRADVNFFFSQYFVSYVTPSGFYLTTAPIITANWEAESGQQWTVPFGGGAGKLVRFGKLPVDIQVQAFYNVVKPDDAADWSLRVQFKALFPK